MVFVRTWVVRLSSDRSRRGGSGGDSWLGGFFCPCHGSKFDLAGRVYKGVPAADNLIIPPYSFEGDNVLVIGVDTEVA